MRSETNADRETDREKQLGTEHQQEVPVEETPLQWYGMNFKGVKTDKLTNSLKVVIAAIQKDVKRMAKDVERFGKI